MREKEVLVVREIVPEMSGHCFDDRLDVFLQIFLVRESRSVERQMVGLSEGEEAIGFLAADFHRTIQKIVIVFRLIKELRSFIGDILKPRREFRPARRKTEFDLRLRKFFPDHTHEIRWPMEESVRNVHVRSADGELIHVNHIRDLKFP